MLLCFTSILINCSSDEASGSGSNPKPTIIATGDVAAFGEVNVSSQSASKNIQVGGANLTGDLQISVNEGFEVSLDDAGFSSQLVIDKATANAGNTTLYVRFSPTVNTVGNVFGNIKLESTQATEVNVPLSGVGVSIAPIINTTGYIDSFGDVVVNQTSAVQSIIVNGDNLIDPITLTTTAGFEISLDNIQFNTTLQIPAVNVNNDTEVFVRFVPTIPGVITGDLTLTNAASPDVVVSLEGNAIPVSYNYVTFNEQPLAFGGGNNQSAIQVFNLHSDLTNIAQIKMYLQIDCSSSGCDDWDRFANIKVKDQISGKWYELGRYITPYWTGTQQLDRGLEFDVTDFKSLLTGSVELRIYIENWTSKADLITVDFDFIEGTPDYPYYAVSEVLGYHLNSIDGVPYGVAHNFDLDKQIVIPANAESTHFRSVISGWGHATPNDAGSRPCAEWCFRTHNIKINGSSTFDHYLGPIGCASNPINNQSPGNWQPDRAGWCPGMAVPTRVDALGGTVSGSTLNFEYDFEDWTNDMANGSAYYATSTYVVVKSNTVITAPVVID